MSDFRSWFYSLHRHAVAWIWCGILAVQLILAFFVFTEPRFEALTIAGWATWTLGAVFGIVPMLALKRRGGVPVGKNYMETTVLVDTGIYALVRHPQNGTAGILLSLALALIGQHWVLWLLAVAGMALIYVDTFRDDRACIDEFGEEYVRYMERVPRVNFLVGLVRLLVQPRPDSTEA